MPCFSGLSGGKDARPLRQKCTTVGMAAITFCSEQAPCSQNSHKISGCTYSFPSPTTHRLQRQKQTRAPFSWKMGVVRRSRDPQRTWVFLVFVSLPGLRRQAYCAPRCSSSDPVEGEAHSASLVKVRLFIAWAPVTDTKGKGNMQYKNRVDKNRWPPLWILINLSLNLE